MTAKILMIGSAHLDVFAEFDDFGQESSVDKIGSRVDFGFGGTALNISAWMQEFEHKPYLLTVINKSSFTGRAVLYAMRAGGLSRKCVIDDERLTESAFVAHVKDKNLYSAISCTGISESDRVIGRLEKTIPRFDWVVFDCNLQEDVIRKITQICQDRQVPAVGAATSDTKATRLKATLSTGTRALCMNRLEARELQAELGVSVGVSDENLLELWSVLNTEILIVTDGRAGWYLVDRHVARYPPPVGAVPKTTIGAGDAVCAGLVDALARGVSVPDQVNFAIGRALQFRSPTRFSERTSLAAMRQYARSQRRNRIALNTLGFVFAVIVGWFIELALESYLELFAG